ncbi:hypothetical protein VNI00_001198 [Paramarasmius palmivorus]|uniref:NADP-dependent oxidoreductase domain-containing protein n=1 Tax=Paramarasmius palmivorus TaxID=297713 RepID=A0AAW0EAL0_9AGAR
MATYKQLGKSGLKISVPIVCPVPSPSRRSISSCMSLLKLGAMSFGSSKWLPYILDQDKGIELLKEAWDLGINTVDTANAYSNGESERTIAAFLAKYKIPRNKYIIMSKVWAVVLDDPASPLMATFAPGLGDTQQYVNQGGLSRAAILNAVDASLARLETSYLDLLQIHAFDPSTPFEETMKALHDVVTSGKARYIGASNLKAWQFAEMNHVAKLNGWTEFVSIQIEHSLLYRPEELEMLAYCRYKGIGIIPYAPLCTGLLARPLGVDTERSNQFKGTPWEKKLKDSEKEIIKRVEKIAKDHNWTMSQVSLAWSLTKVSSPIIGANSPQRLKQNILTDVSLSEEEIKLLEEPYEYQPPK